MDWGAKVTNGGQISKSRNEGAKLAQGSIIVFFDADAQIAPDFLEKTLEEFNTNDLDIATTLFEVSNEASFSTRAIYMLSDATKIVSQYTPVAHGTGECMIIKRHVFEEVNGFDELRAVTNDTEFLRRVIKHGYKYRIIATKIIPSDRRFKKYGLFRTAVGSTFGAITGKLQNIDSIRKIVEKVYGGWADWGNDKR